MHLVNINIVDEMESTNKIDNKNLKNYTPCFLGLINFNIKTRTSDFGLL